MFTDYKDGKTYALYSNGDRREGRDVYLTSFNDEISELDEVVFGQEGQGRVGVLQDTVDDDIVLGQVSGQGRSAVCGGDVAGREPVATVDVSELHDLGRVDW